MGLRETLLSKMNRRYHSVEIDGVLYWMQSLTPAESLAVSLAATDIKTGKYIPEKLIDMQAKQICFSLVDSEGGERIFPDDEWEMLKKLDNKTFQLLHRATEQSDGKGVDVEESLGKSDSAQS